MAVVRPYHKYRGERSFTSEALLAIAAEQLAAIAPTQTRYRVTELPTARTLRFYTARGLVDKPLGVDAGRARYGYRHLLQILAVKYLQAQYLPLVKIGALLGGVGNRDLEQMLPEAGGAAARAILREGARPPPPPPPPPPAPDQAGGPRPPDATELADAWHRIEVSPGVELHVHAAALAPEGRERLRGALLREMGKLRGWG